MRKSRKQSGGDSVCSMNPNIPAEQAIVGCKLGATSAELTDLNRFSGGGLRKKKRNKKRKYTRRNKKRKKRNTCCKRRCKRRCKCSRIKT